MTRARGRDADMTQGNILRQYIDFALPLTVGLLFQQLYSAVDSIVVGNFVGETALGAVGSTGNIINMLIGVCNGLSLGAGAVISQAYGDADDVPAVHRGDGSRRGNCKAKFAADAHAGFHAGGSNRVPDHLL